MIIKNVRLDHADQAMTLSADCKIRKIGWDSVYFRVHEPSQDGRGIPDASPFAAALLLPAMKQGEDLIIRGCMSDMLYKGMHQIMDEVLNWGIGLKPIKIKAEALAADSLDPHRSASFFSGGVDSFYTYLKHKKDPMPADRISSLILVKGYDIESHNNELWNRTRANMKALAETENLELLLVDTNIKGLIEPILPWDYVHGGCLAAVGLFLRSSFRQIYIPSTHSVDEQIPWGSNLALDEHWSTETTTFIHDGTEATRVGKVTSEIAQSPLALKYLRVCYENKDGAYNCGKCDKCLRTMTSLLAANALERSGTFPHHIDPELVASVPTIAGDHGGIFHSENLRALQEQDLAPDLQQAIITSMENAVVMRKTRIEDIEDGIKYLDHVYARGYVYSGWNRLLRALSS